MNEGTAAGLLAYIATKGVAVADARAASRAVTRGVGSRAYAEVVEHLRLQQVAAPPPVPASVKKKKLHPRLQVPPCLSVKIGI